MTAPAIITMTEITARSISSTVSKRLHKGQLFARVLAIFERACNLITHDGDVIALVTPFIGKGPLNVVVDGSIGRLAHVDPGALAILEKNWLLVGDLRINLETATIWDPRPDWEALRSRGIIIESCLPLLRNLLLRHSPASIFAPLLGKVVLSKTLTQAIFSTARHATEALREGWNGNLGRLEAGTAGLTGLGNGLTPAGDDFLIGVMLWAWLAHPDPVSFCQTLVKVAIPRTTTLSGAFLQATAEGNCNVSWHRLLGALSAGIEAKIAAAMLGVLAHGATSGADSLVGFLSTRYPI